MNDKPLTGWRLLLGWAVAAIIGWLALGLAAWALYWVVGVVFAERM